MSSNAAAASVKAMREAEEADRVSKGLREAPPREMSDAERSARLEEIRRDLAAIKAWQARREQPEVRVIQVNPSGQEQPKGAGTLKPREIVLARIPAPEGEPIYTIEVER